MALTIRASCVHQRCPSLQCGQCDEVITSGSFWMSVSEVSIPVENSRPVMTHLSISTPTIRDPSGKNVTTKFQTGFGDSES